MFQLGKGWSPPKTTCLLCKGQDRGAPYPPQKLLCCFPPIPHCPPRLGSGSQLSWCQILGTAIPPDITSNYLSARYSLGSASSASLPSFSLLAPLDSPEKKKSKKASRFLIPLR